MQHRLEFKFIDSGTLNDAALADLAFFEKEIYIPAFPDDGEREPFVNILERIRSGKSAYPQTFAVLASHGGEICGGEIFDWYPDCSSAELIYIALKPGSRGAGLGDELLNRGARLLADSLSRRGEDVGRLYFETENPFIPSGDESMDKVSRIRFFARNSACRVPIKYYQPPLSPDSPWAENLYLCLLPQFSRGGADLPAGELKEFLHCFYRGLGASVEEPKFQEMMRNIDYATESDGTIDCHSFAEEPQFQISRFSLVYHFRLDGKAPRNADEDPLFNSYECDLMNYSLQAPEHRPVRTRHVRLYRRLTLRMPRFYKYTSEGQDFYRVSRHRGLPVTVSVNCSDNLTGNISLAHLVITPDPDSATVFNELDCIRLITAFGSIQEKFQVPDRSELAVEDQESGRRWNTIEEFVSSNFDGRACRVLRNGITELDIAGVLKPDGTRLFSSFEQFRRSALNDKEPDESPWNMAFCGLILGIFDFMRMNSAEISDTIKPIVVRRDSFIVLCRGHLMKVKFDESTEDQTANILVSPYLLIPSAVLSINELVLDRNEEIVGRPISDRTYYRRSMLLSGRIREVMSSLNTEYLQDIFHYRSEQEIMVEGTQQRGLGRRYEQLEHRLDKERMLLEEYKTKDQLGADYFTNAMLAILALLQVTAPFFDRSFWLVVSLASVVAIGAYSWRQLRRRRRL